MKYLIVVDVQNDFVDGSLGTQEAQAMMPTLLEKVKQFDGTVWMTKDTHPTNYLETQEGRNLPVEHCIKGTAGWELPQALQVLAEEKQAKIFEKPTFGSTDLMQALAAKGDVESIELVGLCTDICVISNALMLKAAMPEIPMFVDATCCAGVTPEKHEAALQVLESCQVKVFR